MAEGPQNPEPPPPPRPDADEGALAELATDVVAPVAPVGSAVKADVDRFRAFLRSIQSGSLLVGLGLYVTTAVLDMVVLVTRSFSDWYMHLGMLFILFAFILLYVRAHQQLRKVVRGIYAVLTLALLGFYAWILVDLVPPRLDVLSDRLRPDGIRAPEVVMRPEAPMLYAVAVGLGVVIAWLAIHWLVLGRFRHDHERAAGG